MERVKFIINPTAGRQTMEPKIDQLCKLLLDDGYIVGKHFTAEEGDATSTAIKTCDSGNWDIIIACGGDGTVNEVANGIVHSKNKLPVAILKSGTVNDFSNHLGIPTNISAFFEMIQNKRTIDIDLGKVNDRYFVNVAASGLLTDIGFQATTETKAILGRMAYYIEGLKELVSQELKPISMHFQSKEYNQKDEALLFFVSNTSSIGGFKKLAPDAHVSDGLLDVLIIKESAIGGLVNIFFNILRHEHINHPDVVYFQTKCINVSADQELVVDIDGEKGSILPAKFEVVPRGMKIIVPADHSILG